MSDKVVHTLSAGKRNKLGFSALIVRADGSTQQLSGLEVEIECSFLGGAKLALKFNRFVELFPGDRIQLEEKWL